MELRLSASSDLLEDPAQIVSAFRDADLNVSDDVGRIYRKSMFDLPPQLDIELIVQGILLGLGQQTGKGIGKFGWAQLRRAIAAVRKRWGGDAGVVGVAIEVKSDSQGWHEGITYIVPTDDSADAAIEAIESDLPEVGAAPFPTSTKLWADGRWILEEDILDSNDT